MQRLIEELKRLYLPRDSAPPDAALASHLGGDATLAVDLAGAGGGVRAIVIPFDKQRDGDNEQPWATLCTAANALQTELGFPAPAVSVSGANGYGLWLSLEQPVAASEAQRFVELLRKAYFPYLDLSGHVATAPVALPPSLNPRTGKWAAFIHPGMGASFAEDFGLEMAPPVAAQVAFLEGLQSISPAQFEQAMARLEPLQVATESAPAQAEAPAAGLLLKDATLEDIVARLHAMNIEPTFRHLIRK